MNSRFTSVVLACVLLAPSCANFATAQSTATNSALPRLVRFSGVAKDSNGNALTGTVGITFALYEQQTGGAPLWLETQNVNVDGTGHYAVLLGSTKPDGLPADLFASEQAHWVGVQVSGQAEQPRVLLVSAPYALKAGDAETLGGLPASAFVLATSGNAAGSAPPNAAANGATGGATSPAPAASSDVTTTGGTVNAIPLFSTATNIQNSILTQAGTVLNVGGRLNLPALGAATATAGKNSRPQDFVASVYNSTTSTAVPQTFQWQAEPAGNDTSTASATLNLLSSSGTAAVAETGLKIASNGVITFASKQTFPGTGTITGITTASGSGLAGGGTSGTLSLSIPAAGVSNAMLANPSVTVNPGIALTGGGSLALGGSTTLNVDTTKIPLLAAANTFTGNQTVNGNLSATGVVTGSGFQIGSLLFAFGSQPINNAFLGFAGNSTMTGGSNTATGWQALYNNTTGGSNTANGGDALEENTQGSSNTADGSEALLNNSSGNYNAAEGFKALFLNTTGSNNTASGSSAGSIVNDSDLAGSYNSAFGANSGFATGSLSYATAIGAYAEVSQPNALVLGSILNTNGCVSPCASTSVGIGTTAPAYSLDVYGTGHFTQGVLFGSAVTFAAGQTFPGTGTITGVAAGTGLTGGGTTGAVTLNVDTTKVPLLASANTFNASQSINGSLSVIGIANAGVIANIGDLVEDASGVNNGSYTPGIRFGVGNTGEGISSDRAGSVNPNGIDLYTDFTQRLSVANNGNVGIGTTSPQNNLDVNGGVTARGNVTVTGNVSIGGDAPMSHNPRLVWSGFLSGPLYYCGLFTVCIPNGFSTGGVFVPDQPIIITRLIAGEPVLANNPNDVGCLGLIQGSNSLGEINSIFDMVLFKATGADWDSGPIHISAVANVPITIWGADEAVSPTMTCNAGPPSGGSYASNVWVTVQYVMQ